MTVAVVRGIPIRFNLSALVIFAILVFHLGWIGVPGGVLLFLSVLLHELGHSVVAQRHGIPISAIHLHALGGTATMTRAPERPSQEMQIALAGPVVSLVLGVGLATVAWLADIRFGVGEMTLPDLVWYAAAVNLGMAIFNMIPALPMDGGRVLRAALATRTGTYRATRVAVRVSRLIAIGFVAFGLYEGALTLTLIGVAVLIMAAQEERRVRIQEAMRVFEAEWSDPYRRFPGWLGPYGRRVVVTRVLD